ncbi:nucleotide-diphospho-sugar transferase, partial [Caulochytrium protostelioides]
EILLMGFYEERIFDRFLDDLRNEFPQIAFRYLREYRALGTGGGLQHFSSELLRGNPAHLFVMNADIASSFPLREMLVDHQARSALATVLGIETDRSEARQFGCLVVDPETAAVKHFVEKPETFISNVISCGVYLFNPPIFDVMSEAIAARRATLQDELALDAEDVQASQQDERVNLEVDVLSRLTATGQLFAHVCVPQIDFWMQIKTPTSTIPANRQYLQYFREHAPRKLSRTEAELISPVYVHPSATVHPTARIGPNVSIGPRCTIGKGVRVRDAILLDQVDVKNDAAVLSAVVGWEGKIGAWCRVEGAPAESNQANEHATHKGMKIPTATILGKNVTLANEIAVRNCIVMPHKEIKTSCHNEILM